MSSVLTDKMNPEDIRANMSGDAPPTVADDAAADAGTAAAHPGSISPASEQLDINDMALPPVVVGDKLFEDPGYASFDIYEADIAQSAVVASCPHAGRSYPASMLANAVQPVDELRGLEDFGVDCLLPGLAGIGIPTLVNRVARAYVDVNREPSALDSTMFNGRVDAGKPCHHVRAGYGLIPKLTAARKPIYDSRLEAAEAAIRTGVVHAPYHAALERLMAAAMRRNDRVLLVDFHSMPGQDRLNNPLPDIVLGDGHGTTLDRATASAVTGFFKDSGLSIGWNQPYAGGHITRNNGDARAPRQALQVEINRNIYMDGRTHLNRERTYALRDTITAFGAFLVSTIGENGTAARAG